MPEHDSPLHEMLQEIHQYGIGNRDLDFKAANAKAGYTETPKGYTWHHHQDKGRMQLVETEIHAKTGHTGGFSLH